MDYTRWPEIHPRPPNPNPRPIDPYPPRYSSFHYLYDPSNPNPIYPTAPPPSSLERHDLYPGLGLGLDRGLRRLGGDSYASLRSYPDVHLGSEGHARAGSYVRDHRTVDTGSYEYYSDPMSPNWGVKEDIRQYGADPVGYGAVSKFFSNTRFCLFLIIFFSYTSFCQFKLVFSLDSLFLLKHKLVLLETRNLFLIYLLVGLISFMEEVA